MISFQTSARDRLIINKIVKRAIKMAKTLDIEYEKQDCDMDITACHANGNPLRLQEMLDANDFNFCHDVFGIRNCLNRRTGKLMHMFSPRFSYHMKRKRKVA